MPQNEFTQDEKEPLIKHKPREYSRPALAYLPIELWITILSSLSNKDLARLSYTSVLLHMIADNNSFWKIKALRELTHLTTLEALLKSFVDSEKGLRKRFYRNTLYKNQLLFFRKPEPLDTPQYYGCAGENYNRCVINTVATSSIFTMLAALVTSVGPVFCITTNPSMIPLICVISSASSGGLGALSSLAFHAYKAAPSYFEYRKQLVEFENSVEYYYFMKTTQLYTRLIRSIEADLNRSYYYPQRTWAEPVEQPLMGMK